MATKTSLVVYMTTANNEPLQKSITFANPQASNAVLANFTQKLVNDLTTNTFVDAERINRINLTEALAEEEEETSDDTEGGGE